MMHDKLEERDGVLRCGYCGSVTKEFVDDADEIIVTDKTYKLYAIKNNKQYKVYKNCPHVIEEYVSA